MTALTRRATASQYYAESDTPEEIARLRMIQAKIKGFLQEAHFTLREYPLSDTSDPARYARAVAYYRSSDIEKALLEINYLIEKYSDNPYFHELKGQMLFEFGRVQDSIEPHAKSVELAPDKALLRINLGRALIATEDKARYPEATEVLRSALRLERDNAFGWFELARAYGGLDQIGQAHLATAESRYHARDLQQAGQFARRAMRELDRGSPEWRRASDILFTSQSELNKNKRGRRGERRNPETTPDGQLPQGGGQPPEKIEETPAETSDGTPPAPEKPRPTGPTRQEVPDPI